MRIVLAVLVSAITALPASADFPPRSSGEFSTGTPAAYTGECTSPADLDALPSAHWCESPNSQLDALAPSPRPYEKPFSSVMATWSGGWYDTANDEFCVNGGGHDDGAWDGVWCHSSIDFDWHTRKANSVEADIPASVLNHETFLNGSWSSVHTYGGLIWDDARDVAYRIGGSIWRFGGSSTRIWKYDPSDASTTHLFTSTTPLDLGYVSAVIIPEFDAVFMQRSDVEIQKWDIATNTMTKVNGTYVSGQNLYRPLVWDDANNILVQMGSDNIGGVANHITFNGDQSTGTVTPVSTTGCSAVINTRSPGAAYDPVSGNIYYYIGRGETRVFAYSTTTLTCTEIPAAAGNLVTPVGHDAEPCATGCGVFGRWQRVPSHPGVYVFVGRTTANVVYWRAP